MDQGAVVAMVSQVQDEEDGDELERTISGVGDSAMSG